MISYMVFPMYYFQPSYLRVIIIDKIYVFNAHFDNTLNTSVLNGASKALLFSFYLVETSILAVA